MVCLAAILSTSAMAQAAFGLEDVDLTFNNADGSTAAQAGSHPFSLTTKLVFNTKLSPGLGFEVPDENPKDIVIEQMPGLVGNPTAVPACTNVEFRAVDCPVSSQVGVVDVTFDEPGNTERTGVYSLSPPNGAAMTLGWHVSAAKVPVSVDLRVNEQPPYNVVATLGDIPNVLPIYDSVVTLWGVPTASGHDAERFGCGADGCSAPIGERTFLTAPRACLGPLPTTLSATSWEGSSFAETVLTHDDATPPNPLGFTGCGKLDFGPTMDAQPSSSSASSSSGMDVTLEVEDEGLENPDGLAQSDVKEVVVTLPEGMSANPAVAEGLQVCSEGQLASETALSAPGQGCPEASKIGGVEVETPLLNDPLKGSLYQAKPYDNLADDSLIGLYIVIKNAKLGIVVKQPLRVEPDPRTGQLKGYAEDVPQLPFSRFKVHFREGDRAPLVMPPTCGTHVVKAELTPWAGGVPVTRSSSFQVTSGPAGSPCPPPGPSPFAPRFEAGTLNNQASAYAPFFMRLTRKDGDQEITRFDAVLPPGVVGKIAGLTKCPQAAIQRAKTKSGVAELASPSCSASSKIGRAVSGAGVGSALTYVPGSIYLGGPFNGAPLSVVAIVPAVAGPFDIGTVVVQEALRLNSATAQVEVDGAASDPIPHILQGIPLQLRDLRIHVDRPEFTLNATSCNPLQVGATIFGSFADPLSRADDTPLALATHYQAANCSDLGFDPKLALKLKGGTKRGQHAALRSTVTYPYPSGPGYANIGRAVVILPRSQQIDNAHINNPCTRVQFNENACPSNSVLGYARATSPLLDSPLEGPVYFRSNGGARALPDVVADLNGQFRIILVGFVDTITPRTNPRIRTIFATVPDAPVAKFTLNLFGGKRGLLVSNQNLCKGKQRSSLVLTGQNGRVRTSKPLVKTDCGKKR
jgi:hypothetical protein